jgi:hypothetical protein
MPPIFIATKVAYLLFDEPKMVNNEVFLEGIVDSMIAVAIISIPASIPALLMFISSTKAYQSLVRSEMNYRWIIVLGLFSVLFNASLEFALGYSDYTDNSYLLIITVVPPSLSIIIALIIIKKHFLKLISNNAT